MPMYQGARSKPTTTSPDARDCPPAFLEGSQHFGTERASCPGFEGRIDDSSTRSGQLLHGNSSFTLDPAPAGGVRPIVIAGRRHLMCALPTGGPDSGERGGVC